MRLVRNRAATRVDVLTKGEVRMRADRRWKQSRGQQTVTRPDTGLGYGLSGKGDRPLESASDGYIDTATAAGYLSIHVKTLRKKCLTGEVRFERIGGRWLRFKRSWLDDFAARWRESQ